MIFFLVNFHLPTSFLSDTFLSDTDTLSDTFLSVNSKTDIFLSVQISVYYDIMEIERM